MQFKNSTQRYGAIAQSFHWIIATLIVLQLALAMQAGNTTLLLQKAKFLTTHKSVGMTVFALAVLRLLWRLVNKAPLTSGKRWQDSMASVVHWLLYILILATPLIGWLMSSAKNYTVSYFGYFSFPNLISPDPERFERLKLAHEALGYAILGLAVLHIVAALKHHFFDRDNTLRRMLPLRVSPHDSIRHDSISGFKP